MAAQPDHHCGVPVIGVKVFIPSQTEPKRFEWPQTTRVGEAAKEVAEACGIDVDDPTFQNEADEILDRDKPLVAVGVRTGDCLELVGVGGGVYVVPKEVSVASVESELPPLQGYCERHHWAMQWVPDELRLILERQHVGTGETIRMIGEVDGYPAIPPSWRFDGPKFPKASSVAGKSSIFHGNRVICAPFNRLAYEEHNGPHKDWALSRWREVRGDNVRATTLTEMLAIITAHLRYSPGMN